MKLDPTTVKMLFAAVAVLLGAVGLLLGKVPFARKNSNDSNSDSDVVGDLVRILSLGLIVTGIVTLLYAILALSPR